MVELLQFIYYVRGFIILVNKNGVGGGGIFHPNSAQFKNCVLHCRRCLNDIFKSKYIKFMEGEQAFCDKTIWGSDFFCQLKSPPTPHLLTLNYLVEMIIMM